MPFIEFTGHARLDKRTKRLTRRLTADDVAIIDHTDLDRVSAEELVDSGVRVVVNVSASQSGRFPNPGPLELVRGGSLFRNGTCLATGRVLNAYELEAALAEQRGRVTQALEAFAENTMQYLRDEGRLLAEGVSFPALRTRFRDRHALVVARGPGNKRDLRMVRPYVREHRP